jgi:predicted 2-oxoglutarate/Fe(II)-dependent dioxygenase YbiX
MQEVLLQLQADRTEARSFRVQAARDIKCLSEVFAAFKSDWDETYRPHLDDAIQSNIARRKFIRDKLTATLSRCIDLSILAIVGTMAYGIMVKVTEWVRFVN